MPFKNHFVDESVAVIFKKTAIQYSIHSLYA